MEHEKQCGESPKNLFPRAVASAPQGAARLTAILALLSVLVLMTAGGLTACVTEPVVTDARGAGGTVARAALKMRGVPYLYGGASPDGFDCSGLVHYSYAQAGVQVPRTSRAQFDASTRITLEQARPGDLLFFFHSDKWHVAIFTGNDTFVHAAWPGTTVSTASIKDSFYREKLVGVGRLISR